MPGGRGVNHAHSGSGRHRDHKSQLPAAGGGQLASRGQDQNKEVV